MDYRISLGGKKGRSLLRYLFHPSKNGNPLLRWAIIELAGADQQAGW